MTSKVFWMGVFTAVIWASAFPGIRAGLEGYRPLELVWLRFTIASIVLLVLCARAKRRWPERADLPRFMLLGLMGITAYQIPLNYGQLTVPSGTASMIINTAPIWAAILSWAIRRDRLSGIQMGGIGLGFLGVVVITLGQQKQLGTGEGILLVLFAALMHSGSFLVHKPLLEKYSPLVVTTFGVMFGSLPLLPWAPSALQTLAHAPWPATISVVYLGIFPAALAYVLWSRVLSQLSITRTAGFLYLIPPVSLLLAWIWHGEVPSILSVAGGAIALVGVAAVTLARHKPA